MKNIFWLYIIDTSGATIFSFENPIHTTSGINSTLLSHFIYALQSVAKSLHQDEIKGIHIGDNKFFIMKEKLTNYLFILKTKTDTESKIITPILKNIKSKFNETFKGQSDLDIAEKVKSLKSFEQYVKNLFEGKTSLNHLTEALSSN